jgi:hypothetical protein
MPDKIQKLTLAQNSSGDGTEGGLCPVPKKLVESLERLLLRRERLLEREHALEQRDRVLHYWAGVEHRMNISTRPEYCQVYQFVRSFANQLVPRKLLSTLERQILAMEEMCSANEKIIALSESAMDQQESLAARRGYRPLVRRVFH